MEHGVLRTLLASVKSDLLDMAKAPVNKTRAGNESQAESMAVDV